MPHGGRGFSPGGEEASRPQSDRSEGPGTVGTTTAPPPERATSRDMRVLYVGVIVVEVIVLIGIWFLQQYFGS